MKSSIFILRCKASQNYLLKRSFLGIIRIKSSSILGVCRIWLSLGKAGEVRVFACLLVDWISLNSLKGHAHRPDGLVFVEE